jgi:hypothetical protein
MQPPPVLKARLVHAEPGQRVVEVSAWQGEYCLGSCLGEAASAEDAEERAQHRLLARLSNDPGWEQLPNSQPPNLQAPSNPAAASAVVRHPVVRPAPPQEETSEAHHEPAIPEAAAAQVDLFQAAPQPALADAVEPPTDPEDWSDELAELDVHLQRIGWDRSDEGAYLQRAFGHPSRNRLTAYADLVTYLRCLRNLPSGVDANNAAVPLRRKDLLEQSDQLLQSLQWDANQGRQLLEQQFQLSSRQQLSDEQLLQFNMLLEESLLQISETH